MIDDTIQYGITVTDAFKSYGKTNVLKGLTLKIPPCSIYGLLGPSGCGKSTLIKCILELMPLDFGCIDLNVNTLNKFGYMPQDICLESTLTIRETFKFYGTLYGMNNTDIDNRIDELNEYLIIPNLNSYVNKISGGECRTVSLAISLLHDPKVIILDEPTVGMDPMLRQVIWAEFSKMVKLHGKTIIITTHYIEEASQANYVGLMRGGILIDEGSPRDILTRHGTDTLEEAFLKLCCEQVPNSMVPGKVREIDQIKSNVLTRFKYKIDSHRIKALIEKEYRVFSRDYMLLIMMVLIPVLLCFIYCSAIGESFKGMDVTIQDDEINITDCQRFNIDGCILDEHHNNITMSCVIVNYLTSHDYNLVEVKDRRDGEASMNVPNNMAFLYFPKNYTKNLIEFINNRGNHDNASQMFAYLTKENFCFVSQIETDLLASINDLLNIISKTCSYNPKQISMVPMDFNTVVGQEVKSHINSSIATYIALLANYLPSVFGVSIVLSAKLDGILSRSIFAGVNLFEYMIALFCIITVLIVLQTFTNYFVSFVLLNNPVQITSGLFMYTILIIILGWLGFFFGVLSAVFSTTFVGGCNIVTGSVFTQFILSGALWSVEGQPKPLKAISELLPVRLVSKSLNDIVLKGFTWDHPSVIIGISWAITYFTVFLMALIVLGKYKIHWWIVQK